MSSDHGIQGKESREPAAGRYKMRRAFVPEDQGIRFGKGIHFQVKTAAIRSWVQRKEYAGYGLLCINAIPSQRKERYLGHGRIPPETQAIPYETHMRVCAQGLITDLGLITAGHYRRQ